MMNFLKHLFWSIRLTVQEKKVNFISNNAFKPEPKQSPNTSKCADEVRKHETRRKTATMPVRDVHATNSSCRHTLKAKMQDQTNK